MLVPVVALRRCISRRWHEMTNQSLPIEWQTAYERDRQGLATYADPLPERRLARLLSAFIITGLAFLALPGTFLGVWNLIQISSRHNSGGASTAWIQAHGQAQLLGWVGSFISGISLYILPKILHRPLVRLRLAWLVWALWTVGVTWRWWAGVGGQHWRIGLLASAVLEMASFTLLQYLLFAAPKAKAAQAEKQPLTDFGSQLGIAGFIALALALVLNCIAAVSAVRGNTLPMYPERIDRTFLFVCLWGFVVAVAWSYSTRFVTNFLNLEPPQHELGRPLVVGLAIAVMCALLGWFAAADVLALALSLVAIWALRVWKRSIRPPKRAGVYHSYPAFVRLAYAWLLVGAALGVVADWLGGEAGWGGASRHAITVGFVATLILAIGPRILPSFLNSRELYSSRLMGMSLWLLNIGCTLRVSSEAAAYSVGAASAAWSLLPISAFLELAAVLIFVANMTRTLLQPVPAWFGPGGVTERLPVYWYVSSYPKTRGILIEAGMKTLARNKNVPRSLTLAEAAGADGVDLNHLLSALNAFFQDRQPRRIDR